MPVLPTNFNAEAVPSREPLDLIPPGEYRAAIVNSEERTSKNGDTYICLTTEIVDGEHRGRKLFVNLNLAHPNPVAANIAAQTLAEICRATGVLHPKRTEELHGKPMLISVRIKRQKDGTDRNEVVRFAPPPSATAAPRPAAPVPPWRAAT